MKIIHSFKRHKHRAPLDFYFPEVKFKYVCVCDCDLQMHEQCEIFVFA